MASTTDPALELAQTLEALQSGAQNGERGSAYLARRFEVDEWSFEFFQIVFCLVQRIEKLRLLYQSLPEFVRLRDDLEGHLNALQSAFTDHSMRNVWLSVGVSQISAEHTQPIKITSALLQGKFNYPELSEEERESLQADCLQLLTWLREHQLEEADFIRQAIIEGLEQFVFRLSRLKWLGWEYPLESLKSVIMAYVALERGDHDIEAYPEVSAIISKVGGLLKKIGNLAGASKDAFETGEFWLKAYGAWSLAMESGTGIAGLLTDMST